MQVRLGQTLFGAALGVVTAAGLAGAMAVASGKMEVRKRCLGSPASSTAAISGKQYKTTKGKAQIAPAYATVSGKGTAFFYGQVNALARARASGRAMAEFYGYGEAHAYGHMSGYPVRLAKLRPISAKGYANGVAQGYVFQLMYPAPAKAVATGFGTTYHLAYGHALGEADATGQVSWRVGLHGEAIAEALGEAAAGYTVAFYGGEALAESSLHWEPAITIGGIRHVDAFGVANSAAQIELTNWAYYPSVTAEARAYGQARVQYSIGIRGEAVGLALLQGSMIAADTSAGVARSDTIAVASGRIRTFAKAYGSGNGIATGYGNALVKKTGVQGHGTGHSTVMQAQQAVVTNTKAYPDDGYGVAKAHAEMNRVRTMAGRASETTAIVVVKATKVQFGYGVANGTAELVGTQYRIVKSTGGKASTQAHGSATVQFDLYPNPVVALSQGEGQQEKTTFAEGTAAAEAIGMGANQVNDAVKAPVSRTLVLVAEPRLVVGSAESRIIVV